MTCNSTASPSVVVDYQRSAMLLTQISATEVVATVSGDGAYDTKACHAAMAARGAAAVIPTHTSAKSWKGSSAGIAACNETQRSTRHLGRTIWKKWSGYHRRSLVETKMGCFKLLGGWVMARDLDRQVTELQVCAAILNQFTQLGTPYTIRVS